MLLDYYLYVKDSRLLPQAPGLQVSGVASVRRQEVEPVDERWQNARGGKAAGRAAREVAVGQVSVLDVRLCEAVAGFQRLAKQQQLAVARRLYSMRTGICTLLDCSQFPIFFTSTPLHFGSEYCTFTPLQSFENFSY